MKKAALGVVVFCMLCVSILLIVPMSGALATFTKKSVVEDKIVIEGEEFKFEGLEPKPILTTTNDAIVDIAYPVAGKFYNRNYAGVNKVLLELLGASLVIDRNLEAAATVTGSVDEVEFKLIKDGAEQESKTDDTPDNDGKYDCRFFSVTEMLGVYEIQAIAKINGQGVANDVEEKVIVLHLGESGNKKPVAIANFENAAWESKEVEFDASESYDSDGEIVRYLWDFGDGAASEEMITTHTYTAPGVYEVWLYVYDDEGAFATDGGNIRVVDYDLGVWITTKYNGVSDEVKLDIGVDEFIGMLYQGHSQRNYKLTLEEEDDTVVYIKFAKTTLQDFDGNDVSAVFSTFQVEIDQSTDLSVDHEINLEFRFPYSLLSNPNEVPSEDYFTGRVGYHYYPQGAGEHGPHDFHTWFYFGKNSLQDPGILRMKLDPHPYGVETLVPISYECKFVTVDGNEVEQFHRILSLEFDPAAELTITSVPAKGKINYNFGEETAGERLTISFRAYGGALSDIIQKFIIDPLPAWMRFDLTILGERSFKYEASNSFDATWIVESEQDGELVKLELDDLPKTITVSWGLSINLGAKIGSGFVDLDMSSNLGKVKLYLYGDPQPFIEITNFPAKFRVAASINVPALSGYVSVDKYSGGQTTINIPVDFDKWHIDATLIINDGHARVDFDLPSSGSNHISVGLDTNNNAMFGCDISVIDTQYSNTVLYVGIGGFATQDFEISFDKVGSEVQNFDFSGKITKLIDLYVEIDYQGFNFDIEGSWTLGVSGSFNIEVSKVVELSLDDIDAGGFILSGSLTLNPGSTVSVQWQRGDPGYFIVETNNVQAEASLTLGSKYDSNLYIYANIVLNPNCYVKCDWDWGETGHFIFFARELFTQFDFEALYNYGSSQNEYQYGFKIHKVPSAGDQIFTRTIKWDTTRTPVRIWILGDAPIPSEWNLNVLWNYIWYPVPFN